MPYEKVCLLVAMVVTVILSVLLSGNFAKDAKVVIIDLDNSAYTRELTTRIDASEYMQVTAVLNTPVDPKTLFYEDKAVAVVYFPRDLEKNRFTGSASNIGVYYDNTNTAQTANIKEALQELLALDNAAASGDVGSTNDSVAGQVQLADRKLFRADYENTILQVRGVRGNVSRDLDSLSLLLLPSGGGEGILCLFSDDDAAQVTGTKRAAEIVVEGVYRPGKTVKGAFILDNCAIISK